MMNLGKPTKEQWTEIITVTIKTIGVLLLIYLLVYGFSQAIGIDLVGNR